MSQDIHAHRILILDFGAQYSQLIARRVRELGVYCELRGFDMPEDEICAFNPKGIILSGGPETVTAEASPRAPAVVFQLGVPVLGICYGMQTMARQLGGCVESSNVREFGYAEVTLVSDLAQAANNSAGTRHDAFFDDLHDRRNAGGESLLDVWMSHGDKVTEVPDGFRITATTPSCPIAAMADEARDFYGVQFHPEVTHTRQGGALLERFVHKICGCAALWTAHNIIDDLVARVHAQVGDGEVLLGLSGGVDSSVVAALLHQAIGDRLTCVFVDTGLLRKNEGDQVMAMFAQHLGIRVIRVDAEALFLGLDCAATEFFKDGAYVYGGENKTRSRSEQAKYLADLVSRYPIVSIEDGMSEDDMDGSEGIDRFDRQEVPARRRRSVRHQCHAPCRRHQEWPRQFDPDQGQPDRYADRDARLGRTGAQMTVTPP